MSLSPTQAERRARVRADLRMGLPVLLQDASGAVLAAAAETMRQERFDALVARGNAVLAITSRRAETLKAQVYDGDLARIILPADATLGWLHAMASPTEDLASPLKGPFRIARSGPANLHREAIALAKDARLLPAMLLVPVTDTCEEALRDLACLDMTAGAPVGPDRFDRTISARLPMALAGAGRLHVFRPEDGGPEHCAIEIGTPDRSQPVLTRLHSACFTGDILGSLKCDCGPQLQGALAAMGREGAGILLYLDQEGRGIGLANKMRAYALQDQGFDTVEANHRLGFEDDERDFRIGAAILRKLGVSSVRLMTNNPAKIAMMQAQGLVVTERVPLTVGHTHENAAYLATKANKSGHLL